MSGIVVVGTQWGDEGKGKVVDALAEGVQHVARGQGGNNAGHTLVVDGREHKLHLVPSGVLYEGVQCYIGAGTVIDPEVLKGEIEALGGLEGRLWIAPQAHVILPRHKEKDAKDTVIGTTGCGIGPCYAEKAERTGVPIGELDEAWVKPYLAPVDQLLYEALQRGEGVLLEGAQGTLLDLSFGTYPFVTSSSTLAAGVLAGVGLGPTAVESVVGVAKCYQTRVGAGPMPTEFREKHLDAVAAREFGTTTGRERRIGWLDLVLLERAIRLNGVTTLALTKLDILDELETIKVCIGYDPEPIYEELPGWMESTGGCRSLEQLPENARRYVERIGQLAPVGMISVGPGREQTIRC
jgi:adenylosuccinate synthase